MLLIDIVRRALRSLLNAKTRTILTAFAIAVGAFALTLTLGASNGAKLYVNKIISDNFDPTSLIVASGRSVFDRTDTSTPQEYDDRYGSVTTQLGTTTQVKRLNDADIERIKGVEGVANVREATSVGLKYITRPGLRKYVATLQSYNPAQRPDILAGTIADPLKAKTIILPEAFLSSLGFSSAQDAIGKQVTLAVQKQLSQAALQSSVASALSGQPGGGAATQAPAAELKEESYTIAAVSKKPSSIQSATALYLYANADDTKALNDYTTEGTSNYHTYSFAYAQVADGANQTNMDATQKRLEKLGYGVQSIIQTQQFLTQLVTVLQGIVTAFGLIAVVASVFGIVNTMYISVLQRTREIGLMKALGMRRKDVGRLFRFEAALIGFLGGALGAAAAVGLGTALNPWIAAQLSLGGQNLLVFQADQIVLLVLALMAVATIAGLMPARKASRLNPIEALRTE